MHQSSSGKQPVRVVVRTRPSEQPADAVTLEGKTITIRQTTPQISGTAKTELLSFSCDAVLANASQEKVFSDVAKPICDDVLEGFNGTIMCYGQTGAGKSFTMVGDGQDYQLRGVAPRAIGLVFREMAERPEWIYTIRISCLEIYNENLCGPPPPALALPSISTRRHRRERSAAAPCRRYDLLATLPEFGPRAELSLKAEGRGGIPVKGLTAAEVRRRGRSLRAGVRCLPPLPLAR